MKPLLPAAAVAGLLLWAGAAWLTPRADAQNTRGPDARFAGLQWTFARIRYRPGRCPAADISIRKTNPGSSTRRRPSRTSRDACGRPRPSRSTIPSC